MAESFFATAVMNKYKHLFFDLDHTLWDFDKNARTTLTEIYGLFNLDTKVNAAFDDFYQQYLFHNQLLWDRYNKGYITADDLKWINRCIADNKRHTLASRFSRKTGDEQQNDKSKNLCGME